jgi:arylsulfatase A-like enzyme
VSLQVPDAAVQQYIGQFNEKPYYGQRGYASHQHPLSAYAAMVSYLDKQVGIIMEEIKKLGLDNNTIIMFSSDNGPSVEGGADPVFFHASGGLRGTKRDVYEGGIRVPFIVRWPGMIQPNTVSDHICTQYDVLATLAELTHTRLEVKTDGISFLPTLIGKSTAQKKHEYLYFEFPEKGGQVGIRFGDWKGVRTNVKKDVDAAWQLFNLSNDLNETNNIADAHPAIIKKMQEIQKEAHQHSHIRDWEFIDPKFNEKK